MCEVADIAKTMDEELSDLARELRQRAGHDLRAEAAADEELTELQRLRRLDLAEVARTAMHRGDRVTAVVGALTVSHPVIAVGDDYLTMEDDDRWIDIRLLTAVLSVDLRPSGGRSGRPSAVTFRARMAELEQEAGKVEVVTRPGDRWAGALRMVGAEHLVLASDDRQTYIPLESVVVVFSRFPPRRS